MALIEMCKSARLSLGIVENLLLLFIRIGYLSLNIWKGIRRKGMMLLGDISCSYQNNF